VNPTPDLRVKRCTTQNTHSAHSPSLSYQPSFWLLKSFFEFDPGTPDSAKCNAAQIDCFSELFWHPVTNDVTLLVVSLVMASMAITAADDEFAYLGISNPDANPHSQMMDSVVGDNDNALSHMDHVIESRTAMSEVFSEAHDSGAASSAEAREHKRMLHDVLEL